MNGRPHDVVASLTIALAAVLALGLSWVQPWWRMEARAPQYGKQALVVTVSPVSVKGDVRELDTLGHYVGIQPLANLARTERILAPFGLVAACLGLLVAPWIRTRRMRFLVMAPAILMPELFAADLGYWTHRSVTDRDPTASMARAVPDVSPKLDGNYDVGQFKVEARLAGGFFVATIAGVLAFGLVFVAPLPRPSWNRRRRTIAATAVLAGGILAIPYPHDATAADLQVPPGSSIAAAIAAARDGDTIVVPPGIHREHLLLDRRITLRGLPGAILDGVGKGTVVDVRASGVVLRDLVIRASGDNYRLEDAAIRIQDAASVRITRVKVEDSLFGIFVVKGDDCVIESSHISGKDLPHVRRGDGIRLWYSSGCALRDNVVERSRDVIIWYSAGTLVERNVVRNSRYGLHYMYSDRNVFRDNRFEDNQVGAAIMYSRDVELTRNSFSYSHGPSAYGLLVKDADDIAIENNRFIANSTALFFDGAPQSRDGWVHVRGNLIARNDTAVGLQPASAGIEFTGNSFLGNRAPVVVAGSGNAERNVWAVGGRGNFWSEAVAYDRDGDGVSDIPFRRESTWEALTARHPQLAFFQDSPAAQAIDDAARLFPIFAARPTFTDAHPLMQPPVTGWEHDGASRRSGLALVGSSLLAAALIGLRAAISWGTR